LIFEIHTMKQRLRPLDDDDRLTPEEERGLAFGIAQGEAGLTYGPFEKGGLSMETFFKRSRRSCGVNIRIPTVLFDYLKHEAKRFGMTAEDLIATIVNTHQFKDQDRQLIMLAVERAPPKRPAAGRRKVKRSVTG
jgi:hypothetical protein